MSKSRPTIPMLVEELRLFHHDQAADALEALAKAAETEWEYGVAFGGWRVIRDSREDAEKDLRNSASGGHLIRRIPAKYPGPWLEVKS